MKRKAWIIKYDNYPIYPIGYIGGYSFVNSCITGANIYFEKWLLNKTLDRLNSEIKFKNKLEVIEIEINYPDEKEKIYNIKFFSNYSNYTTYIKKFNSVRDIFTTQFLKDAEDYTSKEAMDICEKLNSEKSSFPSVGYSYYNGQFKYSTYKLLNKNIKEEKEELKENENLPEGKCIMVKEVNGYGLYFRKMNNCTPIFTDHEDRAFIFDTGIIAKMFYDLWLSEYKIKIIGF